MGERRSSTAGTTACEGAATSKTQQENYHLAHSSCVEHMFVPILFCGLKVQSYCDDGHVHATALQWSVCVISFMLAPQCRAFPLV